MQSIVANPVDSKLEEPLIVQNNKFPVNIVGKRRNKDHDKPYVTNSTLKKPNSNLSSHLPSKKSSSKMELNKDILPVSKMQDGTENEKKKNSIKKNH